jgi:hypothetical protein
MVLSARKEGPKSYRRTPHFASAAVAGGGHDALWRASRRVLAGQSCIWDCDSNADHFHDHDYNSGRPRR